jgi:ribosome biogenesis GTPase
VQGRVISDHKGGTRVLVPDGREYLSIVSGKLRRAHKLGQADKPVVGDYVQIEPQPEGRAVIQGIVPRRTVIRRKVAGTENATQVALANVDVVFVTMALNEDFNVRRLERYLAVVWDGGATPVVLLTKADLCAALDDHVAQVHAVAKKERVLVTSHTSGAGLSELDQALEAGKTYALLGSSGVGKSTLVNRWLGAAAQAVTEVRDDGKGRHTTTHRELFALPNGALVVDTPGMRELALSDVEGGVVDAFSDIETLAHDCRFSDCSHETEPDCAVLAARTSGTLAPDRYAAFKKLRDEVRARAAGADPQSRAARKRRR